MNLENLASKYSSDKAKTFLSWCKFYEDEFTVFIDSPGTLLEIGLFKGASSLMWSSYLPLFTLVGIDLLITREVKELSIHSHLYESCQSDVNTYSIVSSDYPGGFDIIIDDASHENLLTIQTFTMYWPLIRRGGKYIVEDLHCSFSECTGNSRQRLKQDTPLGFFVQLLESLNMGYHFIGPGAIHPVYRRDPDILLADMHLLGIKPLLFDDIASIKFGNGIVCLQKR